VPEFYYGRLLDHVTLKVEDVERSKRFYEPVLEALGRRIRGGTEEFFWTDELFVVQSATPTSGMHIAFQAADRDTVDRFHAAGLAAGGTDNGAPGLREYHAAYYAAYVLDPDRNNIEAVHHGATTRSADAVVFEPLDW
jgi:catechol 2,3-dioxygenase-like lactoylglutathione lyase family enzyme